jgi:hypothetical protein
VHALVTDRYQQMTGTTSAHLLAQQSSGNDADAQAKARLVLHWLSSSQRRMPRHKVAAIKELGDFHAAFWGHIGPVESHLLIVFAKIT